MDLKAILERHLAGQYEISQELTGGGMSRVFAATEIALARRVVIKLVGPDLAAGLSIQRFKREIRYAARLQHPHIVPLLSAGEVEGLPYYTMPLVEGESLSRRMAREGTLAWRIAVSILRDVVRALSYAHAKGIAHRDIKPGNVLLTEGVAAVTDFGIAKALEKAREDREVPGQLAHPSELTTVKVEAITAYGRIVGTPAYMAPEQVAGDPLSDHRADFYSWGCMAYELIAGAPPFAGQPPLAQLTAHLTRRPVNLAERRADVPPSLERLIMSCLEKDPACRPRLAAEIVAALDVVASESAPAGGAVQAAEDEVSIAVLPLADVSSEPGGAVFADGLTDEIITDLSAVRSVRVIAMQSVRRYRESDKDPATIAAELHVRYILEGTVRRAGDTLRVTARLIDADNGTTKWSDKLSGTLADVFGIQEKISETIVRALSVALSPVERRLMKTRPLENPRAYECYLQARREMWHFTPESLNRALQLVDRARELSGDNPLLLALAGRIYATHAETGFLPASGMIEKAERCAERIFDLDPGSPHGLWLKGWIHFRRGAMHDAIAYLEQARELEPGNADTLAILTYARLMTGQDAAGLRTAQAAVAVDPLTPLIQCLPGFALFMAGRTEDSLPYYRRFAAMEPDNPAALWYLAWTLAHSGRMAEMDSLVQQILTRFPGTVFGSIARCLGLAVNGEREEAVAAISDELRVAATHTESFARGTADALAAAGDVDGAIDFVAKAIDLGLSHHVFLTERDRFLIPLRAHPRFQGLVGRLRSGSGVEGEERG